MALLYNPVTGANINETRPMSEIREKTQASIAAGTAPDYAAYVKSDPKLKSYVAEHGLGSSGSLEDWGKWHWEGHGKQEHMTGGRASSPYRDYSTQQQQQQQQQQTSGSSAEPSAPAVEEPVLEKFDLAKLTDDMDLSNKLTEIINTNSPLFKAATTKAMQNMQRRGLVNSTLAQEAVMNAVISVALPIAKEEVNQLVTNLYYNTDWTNKQKMQANEAAYNKMLTQVQGKINFTLQQLVGSQNIGLQNLKGQQAMDLQTLVGQQETTLNEQKIKADLWAKYGDWVTQMATTEGADQEAWQRMLDMLKGAGGWPLPT